MKRKLAALLAVLVSIGAHAQTPFPPKPAPAAVGPYGGVLFGRSAAKTGCIGLIGGGGRQCDPTDLALGFFGGLQLARYYGAELGYTNLGKVRANNTGPGSATSQNVQNDTWDVAGVVLLPLENILPTDPGLSAFARLGAYRATLSASERGQADHTNFGAAYGGGLQFEVTKKIALRALWQRYRKVGGGDYMTQNYDVLGLSAFYRFQ